MVGYATHIGVTVSERKSVRVAGYGECILNWHEEVEVEAPRRRIAIELHVYAVRY